ncbi:MAG TPA: RNA chaperone Hfq [Candidatus Polarisedimenticolaceae bacterium]|nr:RNA chaperone Hfq [Candidatus Polarisedimenticolaceae bacterium]
MVNRKLVRPNLAEMKERFAPPRPPQGVAAPAGVPVPERDAPEHAPASAPGPGAPQGGPRDQHKRRQVPPENTSAEAFYYVKQMTGRTPMVVILDNGTELRGHIEWYDRNCIKVNREGAPNLLVYKHAIRYMYKQEEETQAR